MEERVTKDSGGDGGENIHEACRQTHMFHGHPEFQASEILWQATPLDGGVSLRGPYHS